MLELSQRYKFTNKLELNWHSFNEKLESQTVNIKESQIDLEQERKISVVDLIKTTNHAQGSHLAQQRFINVYLKQNIDFIASSFNY